MFWTRFIIFGIAMAMSVLSAAPADPPAATPAASGPAVAKLPPVLRPLETPDTRRLTLPGPPPVTPALKLIKPMPPMARMFSVPSKLAPDPSLRQLLLRPAPVVAASVEVPVEPTVAAPVVANIAPVKAVVAAPAEPSPAPAVTPTLPTTAPPVASPVVASVAAPLASPVAAKIAPVKAILTTPAESIPAPSVTPTVPATASPVAATAVSELQREVAEFCQKQIGHWKQSDARKLLGEPIQHRPAYDEKQKANGTIFAFADPSGKYRKLELDFDRESGKLRSVFVYPLRLTWQQCRKLWEGPVSAADAAQGRKFYSYSNRRLDVLVDPAGRVISLGWY